LPAYLARRIGADEGRRRGADAVARALVVGGVTTVGFLLVFGTLGTAISAGARELTGGLPWAGLVIGILLALAGVVVLAGRRIPLRLPRLRTRTSVSGLPGDLLFGIGYGTASLSCTLPIFLAATGTAVTGSVTASVFSFAAYAVGMGTILTALAVAAALSQQGLALALRRFMPYVNRVSGALLLLAGGYVVYYWAFFLLPGSDTRIGGRSVIDRGGQVSSRIATWLGSSTGKTVAAVLLAGLGVLVVSALWRRLFGGGTSEPEPEEAGGRSLCARARAEEHRRKEFA
jgi:cytochrome c-type biogenesis protein